MQNSISENQNCCGQCNKDKKDVQITAKVNKKFQNTQNMLNFNTKKDCKLQCSR